MQNVNSEQDPADPAVGWVYVIGAPDSSIVKIGQSTNLASRLGAIQTGSHDEVVVRWATPGGRDLERALHDEFRPLRKHGEWFDFGNDDPVALVRAAVVRITGEPAPLEFEIGVHAPRPTTAESRRWPDPQQPPADDPDRDNPLYQQQQCCGARRLTPTECDEEPDGIASYWVAPPDSRPCSRH